ncbi:DegT/DnrJ/EryC1/StrS family aminotransferase [Candidatus Woesearchaeota archaeon]|nr:DegT/DnrJ/EryC1/StrS family aminotransferase [Candidatus Woesearchaeota archaeon]
MRKHESVFVPFLDLKRQYHSIKREIDAAISEVLEKGRFILGEKVEEFEKAFAKYAKAKQCISVGSGTEALHIALRAAGVGPGDEVIVPAHTFIATALAASYCGAKPVFVDAREDTYCIDPEKIEAAITAKTKAVIPVHMYGQYADMGPIMEIAEKRNIIVVEDAAQSHGAEYKGKREVLGDVACYSFYPTKNLGAYGDAGAIVTNNGEIAENSFLLRNYGEKKKYEHITKGFNSRLDELQAAILLVKLKHLDRWVEKKRQIATEYNSALSKADVIMPMEAKYGKHAYYLYVIRSKQRDRLQQHLKAKGIDTLIHYPIPIHKQKAYSEYNSQRYPVAEKAAAEVLSLPMFPELTNEEIEAVAAAVRSFKP